ncbi:MAG: hypothetical protein H0W96_07160 [Solirubrobacterales bacterium]|nr:hypothetical protein [Solirubrobacterales bacterium]
MLASGFPEAIVGVAYDDMGRLYVSSGERIYRIDGKRKMVVAGTGARGHSGDGGPATTAELGGAGSFDVDQDEGSRSPSTTTGSASSIQPARSRRSPATAAPVRRATAARRRPRCSGTHTTSCGGATAYS